MVQLALDISVKKRDGRTVPFDRDRIESAIEMAFRADSELPPSVTLDPSVKAEISEIANAVVSDVQGSLRDGETMGVERVQDKVEIQISIF